jgi:XTP/dITP diphosphohydrolase
MGPSRTSRGRVAHRLVLASNNAGKLAEFARLLAPLHLDVVAQGALGVSEAEEPHLTFLENALIKARHASAATGLPALADDSGICVDALGGAPGVKSARLGGEPRSDGRNNAALLAALKGKKNRGAHYSCVLVLVRHQDDAEPLVAIGQLAGQIIDAPRGTNGFGYDPYFYLPPVGKTVAELSPSYKNRISHRARAMRRLVALLKTETGDWLGKAARR